MNNFIDIDESRKSEYNSVVNHPLQSFEWGEFRKKTGIRVIRRGFIQNNKIIEGFTLTLHKIPRTKFYIGYLPKGSLPTGGLIDELKRIGREENCIFIQLEPNIRVKQESRSKNQEDFNSMIHNSSFMIRPAAHPLFTKFTFAIDLKKSEQELLKKLFCIIRFHIF